jgi:hypothetical protein
VNDAVAKSIIASVFALTAVNLLDATAALALTPQLVARRQASISR